MIKRWLFVVFVLSINIAANAQSPRTEWIKYLTQGADSTIYSSAVYVAPDGSVYLAGADDSTHSGNFDIILNKYSTAGVLLWQRRYAGPGGSSDNSEQLFADKAGYIYLTGSSSLGGTNCPLVIKYNSNGDTLWAREITELCTSNYTTHRWAMSRTGNVCLAQTTPYGDSAFFQVAMFLSDGTPNWSRGYQGGVFDSAQANGIAVDSTGDVVITGKFNLAGNWKVLTIKYSGSDGIELWRRTYSAFIRGDDAGNSLAVDGNNNILIAGQTFYPDDPLDYDFITIKYNPDGDTLWTRKLGSHIDSLNIEVYDFASIVKIDGSNNVIVGGFANGAEFGGDFSVIKYNSSGQLLWTSIYDDSIHEGDNISDIKIAGNGSIFVAGISGETDMGHSGDQVVLKYTSNGYLLWTKLFYGMGNSMESPVSMALGPSREALLTGWSWGDPTNRTYYLMKYPDYLCGDANGDGIVNISDVIYLIMWTFAGGPMPNYLPGADANCDTYINISDCIYVLQYTFNGGSGAVRQL